MICFWLPLALLLSSSIPQDLPQHVTELHEAAVEAQATNHKDRAVYLLRRALAEAAIAGSNKNAKEVRGLLRKLSPDETARKKQLSAAAKLLRRAGKGYCSKKLWAQALPLLSLAQRIYTTAEGSQAIRSCLLGNSDVGMVLPLAKLLAPELAKDYNQKSYILPFKMDGETLLTPTWKTDYPFKLYTGLAAIPGIQIDCEVKLNAADSIAGLTLGPHRTDLTHFLVEAIRSSESKLTGLALYKNLIPPAKKYERKAYFWEDVGSEVWHRLHVEIRSREMTIALDDAPARVVLLPEEVLDGELSLYSRALPKYQVRNALRNLSVQVLQSLDWQIGRTPKKLPSLILSKLLDCAKRARQMKLPELAEAYVERATRLIAQSPSTHPMSASILDRIHKTDKLYKQAHEARASAAKKLGMVAKAEGRAGRKVLATYYRLLSLAVDPKSKTPAPSPEDKAALSGLMPAVNTLLQKAKRCGQLKGWNIGRGKIQSPAPSGDKTATLMLPGDVGAGTTISFELRNTLTGMGFVFGHRNDKDQYTLGIVVDRKETTVFLDQERGDDPINLMEVTLPPGKGNKAKGSVPVLVQLHEHHIFLKIGRLAPRIIALDKRRLRGQIGFRLLPDSGSDPFRLKAIELLPH